MHNHPPPRDDHYQQPTSNCSTTHHAHDSHVRTNTSHPRVHLVRSPPQPTHSLLVAVNENTPGAAEEGGDSMLMPGRDDSRMDLGGSGGSLGGLGGSGGAGIVGRRGGRGRAAGGRAGGGRGGHSDNEAAGEMIVSSEAGQGKEESAATERRAVGGAAATQAPDASSLPAASPSRAEPPRYVVVRACNRPACNAPRMHHPLPAPRRFCYALSHRSASHLVSTVDLRAAHPAPHMPCPTRNREALQLQGHDAGPAGTNGDYVCSYEPNIKFSIMRYSPAL